MFSLFTLLLSTEAARSGPWAGGSCCRGIATGPLGPGIRASDHGTGTTNWCKKHNSPHLAPAVYGGAGAPRAWTDNVWNAYPSSLQTAAQAWNLVTTYYGPAGPGPDYNTNGKWDQCCLTHCCHESELQYGNHMTVMCPWFAFNGRPRHFDCSTGFMLPLVRRRGEEDLGEPQPGFGLTSPNLPEWQVRELMGDDSMRRLPHPWLGAPPPIPKWVIDQAVEDEEAPPPAPRTADHDIELEQRGVVIPAPAPAPPVLSSGWSRWWVTAGPDDFINQGPLVQAGVVLARCPVRSSDPAHLETQYRAAIAQRIQQQISHWDWTGFMTGWRLDHPSTGSSHIRRLAPHGLDEALDEALEDNEE